MSLKQRIAATVTSLMLIAGGLSLSTLTGEAFTCTSGWTVHQKNTQYQYSNYYMSHWLGYCTNNAGSMYYYAGNDSRY
jgi:hypothetical protein